MANELIINPCKFIPGKLYHIKYKGFALPILLHDKIVLCLDAKRYIGNRGKKFFEVKVLVDKQTLKLIDFSFNAKELS